MRLCALFVLAALAAVAGPVRAEKATPAEASAAVNRLAFDLYARLAAEQGDLAFSPLSISTALAMTHAGARGDTERQMATTLHFPADQEALHVSMAALAAELAAAAGEKITLRAANSLWAGEQEVFLEPFIRLVRERYGAGLERVDFHGATEQARQRINAWVEERTEGRIKDLIQEGILTPVTVLVLVNALYMKAAWSDPFLERATKEGTFFLTAAQSVEIPLMRRVGNYRYAERAGLQALEIPYVGGRLSMLVLLPRVVGGLPALEKRLNAAWVDELCGSLQGRKVDVTLPRFRTTSAFSLKDHLAALGMPLAFGMDADFSGMNGKPELFIQAVEHKAFVEVNEEGTEAAAATAVAMGRKGADLTKPVVFRADHPFVYAIRDSRTGCILFLGRLTNPQPPAAE